MKKRLLALGLLVVLTLSFTIPALADETTPSAPRLPPTWQPPAWI